MALISGAECDYDEPSAVNYNYGLRTNGGFVDSGSTDTTAPTITVISTPIGSQSPLVISISDAGTAYALYYLTCKDYPDNKRLTIYDPVDGGFVHPFNGLSTISGLGTVASPYIFTIYRRGRWPTGIALDIRAKAIDASGNTTGQAVSVTVNL